MVLYMFIGLFALVFVGWSIMMVSLRLSGREEDWSADMEKILNENRPLVEINSEGINAFNSFNWFTRNDNINIIWRSCYGMV
jgi:hypothetical protein